MLLFRYLGASITPDIQNKEKIKEKRRKKESEFLRKKDRKGLVELKQLSKKYKIQKSASGTSDFVFFQNRETPTLSI